MEQTYILFLGVLTNGQAIDFAAASYDRLGQRVTLQRNSSVAASGDTTIELLLDNVSVSTFTLPQADAKKQFSIDFDWAAEMILTAKVTSAGGAADLAMWVQSTAGETGTDANWVTPTSSDLQYRMSAGEKAAFSSSPTQPVDPIPGILADIVADFRNRIRHGSKSALGPAGMVPASQRRYVLSAARYELCSTVLALNQFREAAKPDWEEAQKQLKALAEGLRVEAPSNPIDTESPNTASWGSDDKINL